ncbi:MAG: HI0074 family nucleotidyltransferase substrate-binding subunit [Acidaminobacteraceae bacterium]
MIMNGDEKMEDIRWIQRFSNYSKAISQLKRFIAHGELNEFEVQGLIQCFEYTFELAWKTTKDFLTEEGFDVKSPRDAIKVAHGQKILDGEIFLDALKKRNLMAHTYNEETTEITKHLIIDKYANELFKLEDFFNGKK